MRSRIKKIFSVLFIAWLISAQALASANLKINRIDAGSFPIVKAVVSVEQDGMILDALSGDDFKAAIEDEGEVKVNEAQSLKESGENVTMVIAVDTSGSMKQEHLKEIKKGIKKLIGEKEEGDFAALISFNNDVFVTCDFTSDTEKLLQAVDSLSRAQKGITVLFKAIYEGLEMLETRSGLPRLRYLIALSDGKDEGTGFVLEDSIEKAQKAQIPVYSLGFLNKKGEFKFLDNMEGLAIKTEGEYRKVDDAKDLIVAYSIIADKILKQHVLTLDADFKGDGRNHNLEIQYRGDKGRTSTDTMLFRAPLLKIADCAGVEGGSAYKDACGNCVGGTTGLEPCESGKDCAGVEGGSAYKDDCGNCVGGTTGLEPCVKINSNILYISLGVLALILLIFLFFYRSRRRPEPIPPTTGEMEGEEDFEAREDFAPFPEKSQNDFAPLKPFVAEPTPSFTMENPLVLNIPVLGIEFALTPGTMRVGAYPDNNLELPADTVSGYHAEISGNGREWILKDLGSTNGTRLNGQYITGASNINEGDVIHIGPFDIHVTS